MGYFSRLPQVIDNSVVVDSPLGGSWPYKTDFTFYFVMELEGKS